MVFDLSVRVSPAVEAASGKLEVQHLMRVDRYEVYRWCQPINTSDMKQEEGVAATVGAEKAIELCVCAGL